MQGYPYVGLNTNIVYQNEGDDGVDISTVRELYGNYTPNTGLRSEQADDIALFRVNDPYIIPSNEFHGLSAYADGSFLVNTTVRWYGREAELTSYDWFYNSGTITSASNGVIDPISGTIQYIGLSGSGMVATNAWGEDYIVGIANYRIGQAPGPGGGAYFTPEDLSIIMSHLEAEDPGANVDNLPRNMIYGSNAPGATLQLLGTYRRDVITGGEANESIAAGNGSDSVAAGSGADTIAGDAGNDTLHGNMGADSINGGDGADLLMGGQGGDRFQGGAGGDTVTGDNDDDILEGGDGEDQLQGGAGSDLLYGNIGFDVIYGGDGNDTVYGNRDGDVLLGDGGNDWLIGHLGNDQLYGGAGADRFYQDIGSGLDQVMDFSGAAGDRVVLPSGVLYNSTNYNGYAAVNIGGGDTIVLVGIPAASFDPSWVLLS